MANPLETTFKTMQTDERHKKLARALKMTMLKNAEQRNSDGGNIGTWPNVSSINSDNFDTSLAAMSVQSSRIGSEVVSSSNNLRNILSNKEHFISPRNNIATSSENQFSTNKDNDDSAMMPPPPTPGVGFGVNKRYSRENQRAPLLNMPVNSGRNTNGFSMSTPASSISSISKHTGSISVDSSTAFQGNNNYGRNLYEGSAANGADKQERHFSRWRVLLNDKAQLIIKGALDCGKVARSKPVIRRLSATSVQSIFKHTYHLQGNLVDERGELPDYVRGKFYNGFPDDWENVYQLWQNFVNDGSRVSFHWPTPVTDSDDDIKSEITEMTYRPERYKKTPSPRKRNRSAKSLKLDLSAENNENDADRHSCPQNPINDTFPKIFGTENQLSPRKSLRIQSKNDRLQSHWKTEAMSEQNIQSHDVTAASFDSKDSANSLAGYIPEDKLNIIIDNLTNKNCPIEYIQKIVQMFDCMKYVASYPSLENESENAQSVSNEKGSSKTPVNKNRSIENKNDEANTSNSRNHVGTPRPSIPKINQHPNELSSSKSESLIHDKSYKDSGSQTRRQLTIRDYENSESDDDSCDTRKTLPHKFLVPERVKKTQKYKNSPNLLLGRQYSAPENLSNVPRTQYSEISVARKQNHDPNICDEEFLVKRIPDEKLSERKSFLSPRKIGLAKGNRGVVDLYDSSISFTEEEEGYTEKPKAKKMRKDDYDSSVSVTEDEHVDVRNRNNVKTYYPANNARPNFEQEISSNANSRDDRKTNDLNFYAETKSRSAGQSINRIEDNRGRKRLDSLECFSDGNSRHAQQNFNRNGSINNEGKKDSLDYYPEENSRHAEQNVSRNEDIRDGKKRQDSSDYYSNSHSHLSDQNTRRSGDIVEDKKRQESLKYHAQSPLKLQETSVSKNVNHLVNEQENDSGILSPEAKKSKKLVANREIIGSGSSKTYVINRSGQQDFESPESPEISPPKTKTPQSRKKPKVTSIQEVKINLTAHDWQEVNSKKEKNNNDKNSPKKWVDGQKRNQNFNAVKNDPIDHKISDMAEPIKIPETGKPNTRSRDASGPLVVQENKSLTTDKKNEIIEDPNNLVENQPNAEYGSQSNPKLLTAWVPAVICDDDKDKKCHLIFEGKLLNEASHVADRKFVTDIIIRRLTPRIIETINHEFYKLVGNLNDTKHVVPEELIKLCNKGCPGRIGNFCEKWKSFIGAINKSPPRDHAYNTSIDCLSVPMSSRGRRILPPLNYWTGERVATKDNKTVYTPGTSHEGSIPSSFENSIQEMSNKKNSPKLRPETKRTNQSKVSETKKKDMEKISSPNKSAESPSQARESKKTRAVKRRLTKNVQVSSSESDDGVETNQTPRKRKTSLHVKLVNTDNVSTRKLKKSIKNSSSPQTIKDASPQKSSFDKPSDPEVKLKLRKRQKIDENQGTLQRLSTKKPPEIKCMFYKNVPFHDGDLSEDQLSTV